MDLLSSFLKTQSNTEKKYRVLEHEAFRNEIITDEGRRPLPFAARKLTIVLGHLAIHVFGQSLDILSYPEFDSNWPVALISPQDKCISLPSRALVHEEVEAIYGVWRKGVHEQIHNNAYFGNPKVESSPSFPLPIVPLNRPNS